MANWEGLDPFASITEDYCAQSRDLFGDVNYFQTVGGLKVMGDAFDRGMVLAFTLWDSDDHMLWLDSLLPPDGDPNNPGVYRGPCPTDSGEPSYMHDNYKDSYVTFGNIKVGAIDSTLKELKKKN